jgi:hypothetical protein
VNGTATGIEPFEQPERFPRIEEDEVRLVCWLEIQAVVAEDQGAPG